MNKRKLIIGSRASKLALIYADKVQKEISRYYKGEIVIKKINTTGDSKLEVRLSEIGGKGLFSSNIEKAVSYTHLTLPTIYSV